MGRPHIEFIQAQVLPWNKGVPGNARPDVEYKELSVDPGTAESSAIQRFPAGWARNAPEYLTVDEEFFVLEGALEINGQVYGADTYAHLPKGYLRQSARSEKGAVLLSFLGGKVDAVKSSAPGPGYDPARLVERIEVAKGEWKMDLKAMGLAEISGTARNRLLFQDPANGDMTYLTAAPAFKHETKTERHPVVQEFYLLGGEVAGNTGIMYAGAYCWRPPEVTHGPYGNKTGALFLLRSVGGPLTTVVDPAPVAYTFEPEHAPILPPELARLSKPMPRPPRY